MAIYGNSERAVLLQSDCSSIAVGLQSLCIHSMLHHCVSRYRFPFNAYLRIAQSFVDASMLLVCIACPVSVSVHLVCLGRTKSQGTRDTTPAVCSVSLLLAAAAPALGFDAAFL